MKTILALVLAACVAFSAGFYTKGQFVAAERAESLVEAQKEVANDVIEAAKTSDRIEEKIDEVEKRTEAAKVVVRKAPVVVLEPVNCPEREGSAVSIVQQGVGGTADGNRDLYLNRAVVSVLDAARQNVDFDSASVSDEEVRTASDVTVDEFVQNDLEVTRMYHELATRHDELVEFVLSNIKHCQ